MVRGALLAGFPDLPDADVHVVREVGTPDDEEGAGGV
jgi:hypothetical protein